MSESTRLRADAMPEMFERAIKRHYFSTALVVGGLLFIALGVATAVAPGMLVWLMALTFIGLGTAMLVLAVFMRRFASARMQRFAEEFRGARHDRR